MRFLFFGLFFWASCIFANPNCESAANTHQVAIERVVRIALGLKAVQLEDLKDFVGHEESPHPFGVSSKVPENLALKQSFWNHWSKLKVAQRQATRQLLKKLLPEFTVQQEQAHAAQEVTAQVITADKIEKVPVEASEWMALGYLEGRPIIQMANGGMSGRPRSDLVYDHFHSDPRRRVIPLPPSENQSAPAIFQSAGKTYATLMGDGFVFDLATRRESHEFKTIRDLVGRYAFTLVTSTGRGPMLYALLVNLKNPDQRDLVEINLSHPPGAMRLLATGRFTQISESKAIGYHYLSVRRSGSHVQRGYEESCIYRLGEEGPQLLDCVQVEGQSISAIESHGKLALRFEKVITESPRTLGLRSRDLFSRKERHGNGTSHLESKFFEMNGVPYALSMQSSGFLLTNMDSMVEKAIAPEINSSNGAEIFYLDSKPFCLYSAGDDLGVVDLLSGQVIRRLPVGTFTYDKIVMEYQGSYYALVKSLNGLLVMRISARGGGK